MSSNMLINENPLMVLPSLVKNVGLPRAIILQQFHFMLQMPRSGKDIDGFHWVWGTYEELAEQQFSGIWSADRLKRNILQLEHEGYIISCKPNVQEWDHTKYYRVNYATIERTITDVGTNITDGVETNTIADVGTNTIFINTETTTETTYKDKPDSPSSLPTKPGQTVPALQQQIINRLIGEWPVGVGSKQIDDANELVELYGIDAWRRGFDATKPGARSNAKYVEKVIISENEKAAGGGQRQKPMSKVEATMQAFDNVERMIEEEGIESWQ